jgi:putative hydroxymethylpyrimidine transport system substrate-binding protein
MKLTCWLLGFLAGGILLAGCGAGQSSDSERSATVDVETAGPEILPTPQCPRRSDQVRVTLDGPVDAEDVGILTAKRRGYFGDVGLRVRLLTPASPEDPVPDVAEGVGHLGVAQQPQVLIGRDEGVQLIALRSVVSRPTEAMIWLRSSGIKRIADLKGKTIAFPGVPFQRAFLETILSRAGLGLDDVNLKAVGYHLVPALSSGEADAIFGGSWNLEGVALAARGVHRVVTKLGSLGVPGYDESVLFAPYECVYEQPGLFRDFLDAVARGTAAALADPAGAARLIEEEAGSDTAVDGRTLRAQLRATLPLLSRDGFQSPSRTALIDWMEEKGMLEEEWSFAVVFTNYFL